MVEKWDITIPELTGDETRQVFVYLPESYEYDRETRYPVLYMFDGHNVFFDEDATYGKSWGMNEYMEYTETPLIIVGVESNRHPDNGRLREYSPYTFRDRRFGEIEGLGKITMDWMVGTLKPEIDQAFRTLPERETTFIAGSSMGGLMSLYALMEYNHIFSRAAALSPSLWTAPKQLLDLIAQADLNPETVLYMDYGAMEFSNHTRMERLFSRTITALLKRHVLLDCRVIPYGTHCEASWERQVPFFMNALLYQPPAE